MFDDTPVGTLDATLERTRITTASTAVPLASPIFAYGSMRSHRAVGIPVLLNPSTVINIPQKKIKSEYDTFSREGLASLKSRTTRAKAAVIAVQDMFKPISREINIPSVIK